MDIQTLVGKARDAREAGATREALQLYSDAFEVLVTEANEHVRTQPRTYADGDTQSPRERYFSEVQQYLRRNDTAAKISNNMGVLMAELGDQAGARNLFNQAIELTPEGADYDAPRQNLEALV